MPPLLTYQLRFPGGLHIGTRGLDLDEAGLGFPSDTLFSAIVDAWSRTGGDVAAFMQPFLDEDFDPPFLLSSAFPFAGQVRFYPLPANIESLFSRDVLHDRGDEIRDARFCSEAIFQLARTGQNLDASLFAKDERTLAEKGVALQNGEFWLTGAEAPVLSPAFSAKGEDELRGLRYQRVWGRESVPRVTVNRIDQASTIFHAGRASFGEGCGLWFGIHWRRPDAKVGDGTYQKAVEDCFEILYGEGLGGERSTGYGAFEKTSGQELELIEAKAGELAYLLSRYSPLGDPAALSHPRAAYHLTPVSGWFRRQGFAAQRRKRVMLVSEGSLVVPSQFPAGRVLNAAPDFMAPEAIYRSGLALAVRWEAPHA